jgi:hypothetical protein
MTRGANPRPPFTRPALGSVLGQQLGQPDTQFHPARSLPGGQRVQSIQGRQLGGLARR